MRRKEKCKKNWPKEADEADRATQSEWATDSATLETIIPRPAQILQMLFCQYFSATASVHSALTPINYATDCVYIFARCSLLSPWPAIKTQSERHCIEVFCVTCVCVCVCVLGIAFAYAIMIVLFCSATTLHAHSVAYKHAGTWSAYTFCLFRWRFAPFCAHSLGLCAILCVMITILAIILALVSHTCASSLHSVAGSTPPLRCCCACKLQNIRFHATHFAHFNRSHQLYFISACVCVCVCVLSLVSCFGARCAAASTEKGNTRPICVCVFFLVFPLPVQHRLLSASAPVRCLGRHFHFVVALPCVLGATWSHRRGCCALCACRLCGRVRCAACFSYLIQSRLFLASFRLQTWFLLRPVFFRLKSA